MIITPTTSYPTRLDISPEKKILNFSGRVEQIAIRALSELAIALTLTAICIPFVATWAIAVKMIAACLGMAVLNTLVQVAAKSLTGKERNSLPESFCAANFYRFGASNAITLIHETGHFCAAKTLFKGAFQIRIIPFAGGWTKWSTRYITPIGLRLGLRTSIFLITVAGTALALLTASVILIAGIALRHSYPKASPYLAAIGAIPFFQHADYALSALWSPPHNLGHDFVRLKTYGIHPVAAAVTILSIPVILVWGTILSCNSQKKFKIPASAETGLRITYGHPVFEPCRILSQPRCQQ